MTYESRYNGNTKRTKPKENQPGILKIYAILPEIQQRASGHGESVAGVTYLSMSIFTLKLLQLYLVVQGRAQLKHSSHIVKAGVEATC